MSQELQRVEGLSSFDVQVLQWSNGVSFSDAYRGPLFLRKLLGTSHLGDFRVVTCCMWKAPLDHNVPKKPFSDIARFRSLESLIVDSPDPVIGPALQTIVACTGLRRLSLRGAKLSDAQPPTLAALLNLEELDLSHNPITSRGLPALVRLARLKELNLSVTNVAGPGIAASSRSPAWSG